MQVGETRAVKCYHPENGTAGSAAFYEVSSNISYSYDAGSSTVYITALAPGEAKIYVRAEGCTFGACVYLTVETASETTATTTTTTTTEPTTTSTTTTQVPTETTITTTWAPPETSTTTTTVQIDEAPFIELYPSELKPGEYAMLNIEDKSGKLIECWLENDSIAKITDTYNFNPYSANLRIQGISAGRTRLIVVRNNQYYYFEITVKGDASTTATTTTTTPETTTTTTTTEPITPAADYLGDIDRNLEVNAIDAALILQAAAAKGAGNASGLSPEQERDADVNGNGDFDSQDASTILYYSASAAVSYKGSLREFVQQYL